MQITCPKNLCLSLSPPYPQMSWCDVTEEGEGVAVLMFILLHLFPVEFCTNNALGSNTIKSLFSTSRFTIFDLADSQPESHTVICVRPGDPPGS